VKIHHHHHRGGTRVRVGGIAGCVLSLVVLGIVGAVFVFVGILVFPMLRH
jgi:hypothetical protein